MAYSSGAERNCDAQHRLRGGVESMTISATLTLDRYSAQRLHINGGLASRDINLLAESDANGLEFIIKNVGSTNDLVVKSDAPATIGTLNSGEWGLFSCDGTTWLQTAGSNIVSSATFTSLDVDGNIDHDVALTAAGDGMNSATTINHATAAAEGLDVSIAQLTTPRTAGAVTAITAGATSLAGDSGGVYAAVKAVSTDGGGAGVRHIAFEEGGGHDETVGSAPVTGGGAGASTGAITIRSGARVKNDADAGVPTSGAVTVASGTTSQTTAAATGGASGALTVRSGATDVTFAAATGGASGDVTVGSGNTDISAAVAATGGATGAVVVQSGDALSTGATATSGSSGAVTVESGTSADANTGAVALSSGIPAAAGTSGNATVSTGAPTGAGASGNVSVATGSAADGTSGTVSVASGANTSATGARVSGNVTIASGSSTTAGNNGGISGNVSVASGATVAGSAHTGGNSGTAVVKSGDTDSTDGGGTGGTSGAVTIQSGDAASTAGTSGSSGAVTVESGTSADANTGAVTLQSGDPAATGTSGAVTIQSGSASGAGTSGAVTIQTGTAPGGTRGDVTITATKININGILAMDDTGTGTGAIVHRIGPSATEGWERRVFSKTVSPAAVETALLTLPVGHIVEAVWANVESALTGGGTTATWSIGITGDVDAYGSAAADDGFGAQGDALTKNSKYTRFGSPGAGFGASIGDFVATTEDVKLIAAATGGAAAGDTGLTVGSVKVRIQYLVMLAIDDAA